MLKSKIAVMAGLLLSVAGLASPVMAAEEDNSGFKTGDILVRGRMVGVIPQTSTNNVAPGSVGGTVEASNSIIPELDATYFFTPNLGVEAIAAVTRHHMKLKDSALGPTADLGKVELLPPSVMAQWHFCPKGRINPYVGAGINYTFFFAQAGNPLGAKVHYENGFGEVLQVGADIQLTGNWYANVDVKQLFLSTVANVGNSTALASVNLNPTLVGVGIGYKF